MLLDLFNNVPPTPDQIRLTALAASAAGDAGDAYFYMGEYQIAGGDLNLAAQQLQLALASPHISQIQRQRYQARLDEVRDYLMSMRKRQIDRQRRRPGQQPSGHRGGSTSNPLPSRVPAARGCTRAAATMRAHCPRRTLYAHDHAGPSLLSACLCCSPAAARACHRARPAQPARSVGADEPRHLQVQRRARPGGRSGPSPRATRRSRRSSCSTGVTNFFDNLDVPRSRW